jgi:cytochrome c biogenesis protein CcmG/thiol:disulfide interchange protein DsbE
VLVAPRRGFAALLEQGRGGVGDVVLFMLLVMPAAQPAETAAAVARLPRGVLLPLNALAGQFVAFAVAPLALGLLFGVGLSLAVRLRGRRLGIDAAMTAGVYLWLPVGVLALLGAMLTELGWTCIWLPQLPLDAFVRLQPQWWDWLLRIGLSYGWSLVLAGLLLRRVLAGAADGADGAGAPAGARRWPGRLLAGWLVLAWAAGAVWALGHQERFRLPAPGDAAPELALPAADGSGRLALAELRGRPVVIAFWAEWCSVCVRHLPELAAWARAHPGVAVLAVHQGGDAAAVAALVAERGWRGPSFLVDEAGTAARAYRVDSLPTYFFVDAAGRITAVYLGTPPAAALRAMAGKPAAAGPR